MDEEVAALVSDLLLSDKPRVLQSSKSCVVALTD